MGDLARLLSRWGSPPVVEANSLSPEPIGHYVIRIEGTELG